MTANTPSPVVPNLRFPEFEHEPPWEIVRGDALFESLNNRNPPPGLPVLAITQEHGAIPRDEINYHVSVTATSVANYKEVLEGDFIISLRSFQGGIEYSRYHGICSPAYVILRRQGDGTDHFFRQLFKSDRFIQQLTRNIEGIRDGKMISYAQFSDQLLPVPTPAEQRKIAQCFGSLDDLIAAEDRKLVALRQHKQGLMAQLFPREGETLPRLRFPEFQNAGDWETKTIGGIFETSAGGTPERSKAKYWNGRIPWVTTSLIDFNVINCAEEFISKEGLERSSAKIFPRNTVLIALIGQGKTRGKVALLNFEASTNQNCAGILPTDAVIPSFTFQNLCGRYEEIRALSNTAGQGSLSQGLIRALPFSVPKEKAEQQRIADCLSALDVGIAAQAQKVELLRVHKQGLLQQLFPSLEEEAQ